MPKSWPFDLNIPNMPARSDTMGSSRVRTGSVTEQQHVVHTPSTTPHLTASYSATQHDKRWTSLRARAITASFTTATY